MSALPVHSIISSDPRQLELPDPPSDLAQRLSRIYNRAAMRFREHENAQHTRVVRCLEGLATVQSAMVGNVVCKRVIVANKRDVRREKLLTDLRERFTVRESEDAA